jgi:dihydroflavonol-4-reductase
MRLVTGGTGLVGSHLICDLILLGLDVRALKRSSSSIKWFQYVAGIRQVSSEMLNSHLTWVEGDLNDYESIEEAMEGISIVYHSAALVSFSKNEVELLYKINTKGTANLVNACLVTGVKKLCYVSSVAALARRKDFETIDENSEWEETNWNSDYGKSKYLGELEVWRGQEEGLDVVVVNPGIIVGEGDWSKGSGSLFNKVYKGFSFYTMGVTGYIDVLDVTRALTYLGENEKYKGEKYVLVSKNISYRDLFFIIADELKVKRPWLKVNTTIANIAKFFLTVLSFFRIEFGVISPKTISTSIGNFSYDATKITRETGFEYSEFDTGLKRICKHYLENRMNK